MKRKFSSIESSIQDDEDSKGTNDSQKQMRQQKLDQYFTIKSGNLIKKVKKSKVIRFDSYIEQLNQKINPSLECSEETIDVLNSFVLDLTEKIASEAKFLVKTRSMFTSSLSILKFTCDFVFLKRSNQINKRDILTAVKLVLPEKLSNCAATKMKQAFSKYKRAANRDTSIDSKPTCDSIDNTTFIKQAIQKPF